MKHKIRTIIIGRKIGPRTAMLRSLATSLVLKGKIQTTFTKAKAVRSIVEKYITASRKSDLAVRRKLIKYFYSSKAVNKLLTELGPKYMDRQGGYVRIVKLGNRPGDRAEMAVLELV